LTNSSTATPLFVFRFKCWIKVDVFDTATSNLHFLLLLSRTVVHCQLWVCALRSRASLRHHDTST
jgi:hypothetical protein